MQFVSRQWNVVNVMIVVRGPLSFWPLGISDKFNLRSLESDQITTGMHSCGQQMKMLRESTTGGKNQRLAAAGEEGDAAKKPYPPI